MEEKKRKKERKEEKKGVHYLSSVSLLDLPKNKEEFHQISEGGGGGKDFSGGHD